ncbi:MAG: hypothetical protein ACO3U1_13495, partial [Marivivens sp.]
DGGLEIGQARGTARGEGGSTAATFAAKGGGDGAEDVDGADLAGGKGGGGRPDLAQGGAPSLTDFEAAIAAAKAVMEGK